MVPAPMTATRPIPVVFMPFSSSILWSGATTGFIDGGGESCYAFVIGLEPSVPKPRIVPVSSRDLRLDFFRGLALVLIFVDHIPQNIFSYFTLQPLNFFDAAEVFIFISGYTAALVYGRTLAAQGTLRASAQVLRRAWQLYVAHVFLFVIFIAEVSYTVARFNNPMYNDEMRVGDFLEEPHVAIVKALLLQFQPTFLDILPLYIVLLAAFPLILIGLRLSPLLVLIPSSACYLVVQISGLSVPAYPEGHVWFFNPLAWQFLFVIGAILGFGRTRPALPARLRTLLLVAAAAVVAASSIVRISWTIHGFWDAFPDLLLKELWPVDKTNLSPIRLIPFLALVGLVAASIRPTAAFLSSAAAKPFVLCGRYSLEIFCLGILLSALAHFVLSEYSSAILLQIAVNFAGISIMFLVARMLEWYRTVGNAAPARTVSGGEP